MSFKAIKSKAGPLTFLAVIYDEQHPVDSGMCWALSLVDAASQEEAAAKLAHYGGEMLYGKDCEMLRVPKAFLAPLKSIPRGVPIGDADPRAAEMDAVLGDWLAAMLILRRERDHGYTARRTAVAPYKGGVIVAELTDEESAEVLANEKAAPKKPH